MLLRNLIYTLRRQKIAVLLNILGLSCALAIFAVCIIQTVYEINYDRCHKNGKDIYTLQMHSQYGEDFDRTMCQPLFQQFENSSSHIKSMVLYHQGGSIAFGPDETGVKKNFSHNLFTVNADEMFNYQMVEGTFESIETNGTILIPESAARQFFGNEPAVGKLLYSYNYNCTVGGVFKDFPRNSTFKNGIVQKLNTNTNWSEYSYYGFYWLDTDEVQSVLKDMFVTYRQSNRDEKESEIHSEKDFLKNARLVRFSDMHFSNQCDINGENSSYVYLCSLILIAFTVLLIAIINYMNFQMAMVPMRIRSINTQKVFGATARSLRISLIAEGAGLAVISFLISIVWLYLLDLTPLHEWVIAGFLPENNIGSMIILLGIAAVTGIISAIYPSLYITSFQPAMALKGSFGKTAKGSRLRIFLIGFQYTASFTLIMMALLMNQQIRYMIYAPKGYDADYLITYSMGNNHELRPHLSVLEQKLRDYAFIENCATAENIISTQNGYMGWGRTVHGKPFQCETIVVNSAEYLNTMGIKITGGRNFNDDDVQNSEGALIFNELARKKYELVEGDVINPGKVVGFMDNINYATMSVEIRPMCIWLNCQGMWGRYPNIGYVRVSKESNMHEAREAVMKEIETLAPEYNGEVKFVNEYLEHAYKSEQNMMRLMLTCSFIAVLISVIGVFGIICFENQYRRKEIGLRKVMGDTTQSILFRLNRRYFRVLLIGFAISIPLSVFAFGSWLDDFAYRTPFPLWIFPVALALLSTITFIIITLQSWKTAKENPINSIRTE